MILLHYQIHINSSGTQSVVEKISYTAVVNKSYSNTIFLWRIVVSGLLLVVEAETESEGKSEEPETTKEILLLKTVSE